MRKFISTVALTAIVLSSSLTAVHAETSNQPIREKNIQLTDAQKQELSTLHKELLTKRKEVIQKYVEYGVMPKEKGDKIMSHLEKRYDQLEENNFIPKWEHHKKHHSH
ncbi:YckD family protein [Metabacillus iocasae]|uniref:Flagellar motility protein MotE (MotC chaperone) n=1 Tax=Priestia iocasae TaxID=2291674 RepID=A0ABS2QU81_9BACI|nr:YckD family protein [Metabacillus iocasae]MBM7702064.1 flagellar motility protein MotE (MotC chaperone) [Metabacillus iocasae]